MLENNARFSFGVHDTCTPNAAAHWRYCCMHESAFVVVAQQLTVVNDCGECLSVAMVMLASA
jgi:hypothetical protein